MRICASRQFDAAALQQRQHEKVDILRTAPPGARYVITAGGGNRLERTRERERKRERERERARERAR